MNARPVIRKPVKSEKEILLPAPRFDVSEAVRALRMSPAQIYNRIHGGLLKSQAATPGVASVHKVEEGLGAIVPAVPQVVVSFAIGNHAQGVFDLVPVESAKSAAATHPAVHFVRLGRTG